MKNVLVLILAGVLTCSAYGAIGDSWDCGLEFGVATNPNGAWAYKTSPGETLMVYTETANIFSPPPGWENVDTPHEGLYGWYPSFPTPSGDLIDPNDFGGHNPWMVEWTSPVEGWIQISGAIWQRSFDNGKRLMQWSLRHNGSTFDNGYGLQDLITGVPVLGLPGAALFEDGVGGSTGLYRQVSIGDTTDLITAGTPEAELPIPYTGPGAYEPWGTVCLAKFTIRQVDPDQLPTVTLTMAASPGVTGSQVSPAPGDYTYVVGTPAPISASPYINCPTVMAFDHWDGGALNPLSASTTVLMDTDKTVTAVYVDNRACGDECHPTWPDVPTDLNGDCRIDVGDFGMLSLDWLNSTHPDDDLL